jgi:NLI interacting factor-like phosphatase
VSEEAHPEADAQTSVARPVWAFDVDGTLIGSIRSDRLRPGAGDLLTDVAGRIAVIVLWSAGGAEYARRMADRHGLADFVDAYYAKDRRGVDGRYVVDHFASTHRPTIFVDDAPGDLPLGAQVVSVPQFFGSNASDVALYAVLATLQRERPEFDRTIASIQGRSGGHDSRRPTRSGVPQRRFQHGRAKPMLQVITQIQRSQEA